MGSRHRRYEPTGGKRTYRVRNCMEDGGYCDGRRPQSKVWPAGLAVRRAGPDTRGWRFGRGIPDVVAAADPTLGIGIRAGGRMVKIGGTTESVALWAGLLALVNQGLGRNV